MSGDNKYALNDKNDKEIHSYNFFGNIIMLSNNEYTYPVSKDDRRAVPFLQNDKLEPEHYAKMQKMVEFQTEHQEELENFACYLANKPIGEHLEHLITQWRADVQELSKTPAEEFVDLLSENYNQVINDINHKHKMSFPTLVGVQSLNESGGYFIRVDLANDLLQMSTNLFTSLYNLKYKENDKSNKHTYTFARKNDKFSYDKNKQQKVNGNNYRYITIKLT